MSTFAYQQLDLGRVYLSFTFLRIYSQWVGNLSYLLMFSCPLFTVHNEGYTSNI